MVNLLHGNALELIKDVPDKSIDLIFTDPPYNQNIKGKEYSKEITQIIYLNEILLQELKGKS